MIKNALSSIGSIPSGEGLLSPKGRTMFGFSMLLVATMVLSACGGDVSSAPVPNNNNQLPTITYPTATATSTEVPFTPPKNVLTLSLGGATVYIDQFGEPHIFENNNDVYHQNFRSLRIDEDNPRNSELFNAETPIQVNQLMGLPFSSFLVDIGPHQIDSQSAFQQSWNFVAGQMGSILDRALMADNPAEADQVRQMGGAAYLNQLATVFGNNSVITVTNAANRIGDNGPALIMIPAPRPELSPEEAQAVLNPGSIQQALLTPVSMDLSDGPAPAIMRLIDPYQPPDEAKQLRPGDISLSPESGARIYVSPETNQLAIGVNIPAASNLLPDQDRYQTDDVIVRAAFTNEIGNLFIMLLEDHPELLAAYYKQLAADYGTTPEALLEAGRRIVAEQDIIGPDPDGARSVLTQRVEASLLAEFSSSLSMINFLQTIP